MASLPASAPRRGATLAVLGLLLLATAAPATAASPLADKVVIVILDGPRLSETFEEPGTPHIPNLASFLPGGATIPEFQNQGSTYTLRGHASILTGTWQHIANDGSERPTQPTLFEYYRAATGARATDVWLVGGKDKLAAMAYSDHSFYGQTYAADQSNADRDDVDTYADYRDKLATYHPTLSMLSLSEIDIRGHSLDWEGYLEAIVRADSLVADLWSWLESDPAYAGRTDLFLTYDHGRHDDGHGGFQNHGDGCPGCVRLGFLALGPDFEPGAVSSEVRAQLDLCTTVGAILDFPVPFSEGELLEETFLQETAIRPSDAPAGGRAVALRVAPNPFNPLARIRVMVTAPGQVQVRVFDSLGRPVAELLDAFRARGAHNLSWNGRNAEGRPVASGIYFVEARAAEARAVRKLTLLR